MLKKVPETVGFQRLLKRAGKAWSCRDQGDLPRMIVLGYVPLAVVSGILIYMIGQSFSE